ncbi:cell division cycle-associated protein 7 [Nasonia vitripennis]|uniref:Zinc-finger domain-containing protein n=1 Tax=Nasonia vitripennis TaxID=7425 RepID=A0A7M7G340_NASVI|nr:cell division cycle-associated protein 7 [Nasonia vitripennis]
MSDTEDYEALRLKNIAERNAFLQDFLKDIKEDTEEIKQLENTRLSIVQKENRPPRTPRSVTRRRRSSANKSPTFTGPVRLEFRKKYNTRSKKRKLEEGENDEEDDELKSDQDIIVPKSRSNLKVMFPWSRPLQRDLDLMKFDFSEEEDNDSEESDEELYAPTKKKRMQRVTKSAYDPSAIPSPDEITPKMLNNIAQKASGKVYDAVNGSSCHQCRQKTKDTKTVCRSGECIGVRGQFCGPCLRGRYGESALEALQNPHWACPPCRGLCNCSICRTRNGQRPTGILAPLAKEEGFESVKDYLQANDDD